MAGLEDVEEQENERFRNVLNRNKQKSEIYTGSKRTRDDDNEEGFHGLFDNEHKGKNKFSSARNKKREGRTKKRRS